MPTAYLLHGFIGVGKSTLARAMEAEGRGVRFSNDEWYLRLYGDMAPPGHLNADLEARTQALLDDVWTRVLAAGTSVILDFGLWSRVERDRVRSLVADVGATADLYWVQCPEAVALERVRTRNENPGDSWFLDETSFEYLRQKYHPLDPDEVHTVVRSP